MNPNVNETQQDQWCYAMKNQVMTTVAGVVLFTNILTMSIYAAETELVGSQTVWRVWAVSGSRLTKDQNGKTIELFGNGGQREFLSKTAALTELPPATWYGADFDDSQWVRYGAELYERMGGFGCLIYDEVRNQQQPILLYLRTRFGVSDPAKATDLKVTLEYLGGAVVCVNGVEVGRNNLPEGPIDAFSLATDYPIEAYVTGEEKTPLPALVAEYTQVRPQPEAKWLSRYQARLRKMTVDVPAKVLVKGTNVLTLEMHRARRSGPSAWIGWGHVGIQSATLRSTGGTGVIAYEEALKGTRSWSAQPVEQITERPIKVERLPNAFAVGGRGGAVVGITDGNPFDPVIAIRIQVPRNGIGNGMTVLSDSSGLRGVSASIKDFTGPGGAILPANSAQVRFAVQEDKMHCCDTLLEKAPAGAKTLPVWLEVKAPRNQTPGWYVSQLALEANGKKFQVPVQIFVTGYVVPDSKDFRSLMGVMHSPEAAAKIAKAAPWSEAHFAVMAKSLEVAGLLGNDIMYVPVMVGDHMGHQTGLIRWIKTPGGLQPDFTAFEKYLDLYTKYCAAPRAIILYVWSPDTVKEVANAYEGRAIPTRESKPSRPLQVTQWDPATGTNTAVTVPTFTDDRAESFWKPMLDGVHAIVLKRGWSERAIMVGTGSDLRPSQKTGEIFRNWAPYARWDIYSHFSGDPAVTGVSGGGTHYKGPTLAGWAPGKMIAIGNLEVGVKEFPWGGEVGLQKLDFLEMPLHRSYSFDGSSPLMLRTLPMFTGRLARLGLDFWPGDTRYAVLIWGEYPRTLLARSDAGPVPTVRLQMMREGVQDFEPRLTIMEAIAKLSKEEQKPYTALLNDFTRRWNFGQTALSQSEINLNWPSYLARIYRAAEELTGIKTEGSWEDPPK